MEQNIIFNDEQIKKKIPQVPSSEDYSDRQTLCPFEKTFFSQYFCIEINC